MEKSLTGQLAARDLGYIYWINSKLLYEKKNLQSFSKDSRLSMFLIRIAIRGIGSATVSPIRS